MADQGEERGWYCVRTVLQFSGGRLSTYEERLTLWAVAGFEAAVQAAESEAREYADSIPGCAFVGLDSSRSAS